MQRYPDDFSTNDRRIARKWRLGAIGFYGSILAGMFLYASLSQRPDTNGNSAISQISRADAPSLLAYDRRAVAQPPSCRPGSC
jgi:hypothetical protein